MRLFLASVASFVAAATTIACTTPPITRGPSTEESSSSNNKKESKSDEDEVGDEDEDVDGPAPASAPASDFDCTGAGIAGFADRLVKEARKSCTSAGAGVVTNTNYECMRDPIKRAAPPFPDAAFERVKYWATKGNNFAGKTTLFQCVDFAFTVTAGVCGKPINAGDAQIDTNMTIPGYQYMSAAQAKAQAGDVLVFQGHIAITAQVASANKIRVAEANCLTLSGQATTGADTGVISNTRMNTLNDGWLQGWYRKQ